MKTTSHATTYTNVIALQSSRELVQLFHQISPLQASHYQLFLEQQPARLHDTTLACHFLLELKLKFTNSNSALCTFKVIQKHSWPP